MTSRESTDLLHFVLTKNVFYPHTEVDGAPLPRTSVHLR